jgi:hypothetical protein
VSAHTKVGRNKGQDAPGREEISEHVSLPWWGEHSLFTTVLTNSSTGIPGAGAGTCASDATRSAVGAWLASPSASQSQVRLAFDVHQNILKLILGMKMTRFVGSRWMQGKKKDAILELYVPQV